MHRVPNFGSALQAYALQKKLFQHGYDNRIIDYLYTYDDYNPTWWRRIFDKTKYHLKVLLRHPIFLTHFHKFRRRYLKTTWQEYTKQDLMNKKVPSFDVYMTGSDQVWNCRFTNGDTNFLLKFAPENAHRLSYGASFASPGVPKQFESIFKEELSKYDSILVRECSGINIVKELTGKKAEVVCDPTLWLTAQDIML